MLKLIKINVLSEPCAPEVCAFAANAGRNQIALYTPAGRRAETDGGPKQSSRRRESNCFRLRSIDPKLLQKEFYRKASG